MRAARALIPAVCLAATPQGAAARELAIPPCTLAEAIDIIARSTGVSIGTINPALLRRRIAPMRVSGNVDAMLRQVLGQGVVLRRLSTDFWLIVGLRRLDAGRIELLRPAPRQIEQNTVIVVAAGRANSSLGEAPLFEGGLPADALNSASKALGSAAILEHVALLSSTHIGPGRDKLFLRGIADSSFAGTRAATVAQYLGEQRLTYRGPDPNLLPYDLERVDVLPGGHGVAYGTGGLGGIIRLVPTRPVLDTVAGSAWGGLSSTSHGAGSGDIGAVANLTLVEARLGVRALGYKNRVGGYIDDTARGFKDINRVDTTGGRLTLRYQDGAWTADFTLAAQHIKSRDAQYVDFSGGERLERRVPFAEPSSDRVAIGSATLRWDGGSAHTSATVGAVRQNVSADFAAVSADRQDILYRQAEGARLLMADLRAWRDLDVDVQGEVGWLIGLSVLTNRARQTGRVLPRRAEDTLWISNQNLEFNAFGELSLRPATGVVIKGGLRFSRISLDGKAFGKLDSFYFSREHEPVMVERTRLGLLPSLAASLDLAAGTRAFIRFERGYRPGGVESGVASREFASDKIATLELGLRGARLGPAEVDVTLAWSRWSDVQADLLTPIGLVYTENIGNARILSGNIELKASMTARLELRGAVMLVADHLDAVSYLRDGSASLPNVPSLSMRGLIRYEIPLANGSSLAFDGTLIHEGASRLGTGRALNLRQGNVERVDFAARLGLGKRLILLSVENLLDARSNLFALGNPFTLQSGRQSNPQRPRTIRIGIEASF